MEQTILTITELKARAFDILAAQEQLQAQFNSLEQMKRQIMEEINARAASETHGTKDDQEGHEDGKDS